MSNTPITKADLDAALQPLTARIAALEVKVVAQEVEVGAIATRFGGYLDRVEAMERAAKVEAAEQHQRFIRVVRAVIGLLFAIAAGTAANIIATATSKGQFAGAWLLLGAVAVVVLALLGAIVYVYVRPGSKAGQP